MKTESGIYYRASGVGALQVEGRGTVLTENMKKEYDDFKAKIRLGGSLTPAQQTKFNDYKKRDETPPELSDTAKQFIEDTWLLNEKGFYKDLKSHPVQKGIFGEEDSISLLTQVFGNRYKKNTERKFKGNLTGECDILFQAPKSNTKIIIDNKASWDPKTFMNAKPSTDNEWQGRTYMDLYDADEFWLTFTLIDCPPHLVAKQKEYLWREYFSDSMGSEEMQVLEERLKPLMDQIDRNLVYTTSGKYTPEERVKVFKFTRDDDKFKTLLDKIPMANDYYKTIKLNQINSKYV